jgi:hypothetical protein
MTKVEDKTIPLVCPLSMISTEPKRCVGLHCAFGCVSEDGFHCMLTDFLHLSNLMKRYNLDFTLEDMKDVDIVRRKQVLSHSEGFSYQ